MRITPCESTPRRFAHTTASAQRAAISGATLAAAKIAAAKLVRSDLLRRTSSLMPDELAERHKPVERRASARRNLHQLGELLLGERHRRVFELDRVAHDDVETDHLVGIDCRLREEPIPRALGL